MIRGVDLRRRARAAPKHAAWVLAVWSTCGCASSGALSRPGEAPLPSWDTTTSVAVSQPASVAQTLESWDPRLSSALSALVVGATTERYYRVALEYRRLGVLDMAFTYLTKAVGQDASFAPAYDVMARIWRDWGFSALGLPDAQRAVRLAPRSAEAANTLGTLFQAIARPDEARRWYERAHALDEGAAYVLNNLCYVAIVQRDGSAVARCERALSRAPGSETARNNLALAYAARGDFARAREIFEAAGDPRTADHNMSILALAARASRPAAGDIAGRQPAPQTRAGVTIAKEGKRGGD